ncbi:MAG: tRNA (adenosine(37)-N6)-threonylcarbamoyltransferase complex ATPase subunit type 1 TsaE [Oscillospiraceae bacterium]|nr:tRNA (adenosine(37)-N6)-threonylcarbamoyltransferase complex ATPase subunit type 1 TsaE [Oscillospiraceae bacterium]
MFARVTVSPEHTLRFAEEVGKRLEKGTVILYEGDLGAGKTTFTKGLARGLGITETVTSPTFALVNEYYGRLPLFHFDLYRINSVDELYSIGFFDYLDKDGVIAAEWSENIPELEKELKNVVKVRIDKLSDTERRILLLWS